VYLYYNSPNIIIFGPKKNTPAEGLNIVYLYYNSPNRIIFGPPKKNTSAKGLSHCVLRKTHIEYCLHQNRRLKTNHVEGGVDPTVGAAAHAEGSVYLAVGLVTRALVDAGAETASSPG
jgi:hypothetical protein